MRRKIGRNAGLFCSFVKQHSAKLFIIIIFIIGNTLLLRMVLSGKKPYLPIISCTIILGLFTKLQCKQTKTKINHAYRSFPFQNYEIFKSKDKRKRRHDNFVNKIVTLYRSF